MFAATSLYASLIAAIFLVLSVRVILYRREAGISLGDKGDAIMLRRIRAQGNCAEYAPMGLILLALVEAGGMPGWAVHGLGLILLAGRLLHAIALSSPKPNAPFRIGGMALTFTMLGLSVAVLLVGQLV